MGIERPSWDEYFLSIARVVSTRSIDTSTKCGCVIVDTEDKSILTTGYNSPPRGLDDTKVPMTRPEKYIWMVHAEEAAIANAARHGIRLKGSTAYITGKPCPYCARKLINAGIKHIKYGDVKTKGMEDTTIISEKMLQEAKVSMECVCTIKP